MLTEINVHKYLVHAVTQCLELLNSSSGLFVRVISGTNSPHTCRLVTGVTLSTIVEIRVGTTRTISKSSSRLGVSETGNCNILHIHTNVACHSYVWATVGFTHNCDHGNLWVASVR